MSFERNTSNQPEPKKRSLFRTMFVPDVMGGMSGIGESLQMFVKLIAQLFVLNGLFPREHPAVQPRSTMSLSLGEILVTGWERLSFKRENLPQIFIYFSVVSTLLLSLVILISFISSVLITSAHAEEATSMFVPPNPSQDLAHNWLGYLFKGQDMNINVPDVSGTGNIAMPPQPHTLQNALMTTLAYYSTAILVFAGIILMYHLVVMIAETAHSGVPMGRNANQVWAPIRLVFAIGLLVPISGGLNTGQYMAVQIADWGAGLASNVWKTFLDALASDQTKYVPPTVGSIGPVVQDLILSYACESIYNKLENASTDNPDLVTDPLGGGGSPKEEGLTYSYAFGNKANHTMCGYYTVVNPNNVTDTQSKAMYQAAKTAFEQNILTSAVRSKIDDYITHFMPSENNYEKVDMNDNSFVANAVDSYQQALKSGISSIYSGNSQAQQVYTDLATKWSGLGFAASMAWIPVVAYTQQIAVVTVAAVLPTVTQPELMSYETGAMSGQLPTDTEASIILKNFAGWLQAGTSSSSVIKQEDYVRLGIDAGYGRSQIPISESNGIVKTILALSGMVTDAYSVFQPNYGEFTVGKTGNPFAEVAAFGHRNIVASFAVLDQAVNIAGILAAVKTSGELAKAIPALQKTKTGTRMLGLGLITSQTAGSVAQVIMSIAGLFATLLFTTGLLCGYFVPLVPFATFFFNVLAWIVSVFESVVSMPLLALAHLTTKGEGLPGDMARQGYFFLFSIFLRPTLMVFGLIAGLLIFYVAVSLLNVTYSIAVRGVYPNYVVTGKGDTETLNGFEFIARAIFNVIYGLFVYICANSSFNTIKFFPEHAMRWMASQGVLTEKMGDKQLMSSAMTGITAYAFRDTVQSTVGAHPGITLVAKNMPGATGAGSNVGAYVARGFHSNERFEQTPPNVQAMQELQAGHSLPPKPISDSSPTNQSVSSSASPMSSLDTQQQQAMQIAGVNTNPDSYHLPGPGDDAPNAALANAGASSSAQQANLPSPGNAAGGTSAQIGGGTPQAASSPPQQQDTHAEEEERKRKNRQQIIDDGLV